MCIHETHWVAALFPFFKANKTNAALTTLIFQSRHNFLKSVYRWLNFDQILLYFPNCLLNVFKVVVNRFHLLAQETNSFGKWLKLNISLNIKYFLFKYFLNDAELIF